MKKHRFCDLFEECNLKIQAEYWLLCCSIATELSRTILYGPET